MGILLEHDSDAVVILPIEQFQEGVVKGEFNDKDGKAWLIINDIVQQTHSIHIDRQIVTSVGKLVSFNYLMREYGPGKLKVKYQPRPLMIPDLEEYMRSLDRK